MTAQVMGIFLEKTLKAPERLVIIEEYTVELLFTAACRLSRTRKYSIQAVYSMLAAFPCLLWNRRAVKTMLDILQCLDARSQSDTERKVRLAEVVI